MFQLSRYHAQLVLCTVLLGACDGIVNICGEYACLYYERDCERDKSCDSSDKDRFCESATSVRDRVPAIINSLRTASRQCAGSTGDQAIAVMNVVWDDRLANASNIHAKDMARYSFTSFTGTNGSSSHERATAAGAVFTDLHESVLSGPQTAAEAINSWLDTGTDCRALLNSNLTAFGMACVTSDDRQSGPYWSMLLSGP